MPCRSPQTQERVDLTLERPSLVKSGELPRSAAVELGLRRLAPPTRALLNPSRSICLGRLGLDRVSLRSEPLDLDPTALIRAYRFGLEVLLKSPCPFSDSTRSPELFKNNYRLGLFYSLKPLSVPKLVPAVQCLFFYELDPGVNG